MSFLESEKPVRPVAKVVQLLLGTVQPEKCSIPCSCCGTESEKPTAPESKKRILSEICAENEFKGKEESLPVNDVKQQTKYRASVYRSAANVQPVKYRATVKPPTELGIPQRTVFQYWRIMYAKPSGRKNKIWEDDGTLAVEEGSYVIRGSDGGEIAWGKGASANEVMNLSEGKIMLVGSKEIQLLEGISSADYKSGAYLL